jgi:hypothetical protein
MNKTAFDPEDPDLAAEYDFSGGIRGKYAERYREGSNVVLLAPDVAQVFRTAEAVNEALRALIQIAKHASEHSAT